MTLKRKFLSQNLFLLVSLVSLAAAALWGLLALRHNVRTALYESAELQLIESATIHVANASIVLHGPAPDDQERRNDLHAATLDLQNCLGLQRDGVVNTASDDGIYGEKAAVRAVLAKVRPLLEQDASAATGEGTLAATAVASSNLRQLMGVCHQFISAAQNEADRNVRRTLLLVSLIGGATLAGAGVTSISQYRSVVVPLQRMRQRVRTMAAGNFSDRLPLEGDREFNDLTADFNRMAGELDQFYRRLEEMVAIKSRELVRSERLASVGFLAAGVAHEINNPLNIMSGYAELSMKRLKGGNGPEVTAQIAKALNIIREEAFRCRDITEKLLSLSRQGGKHEVVSLRDVVDHVATMVRGHIAYLDRHLSLEIDETDAIQVCGNAGELKQVLLNLTINALEAASPGTGEVRIAVRRVADGVELSVIDNGRGMLPAMVEQVFEPFFTEKRGAAGPGTGLGLSITHAIVRDHGGRITAHSEGTGRGSTFTVHLPAQSDAPAMEASPG